MRLFRQFLLLVSLMFWQGGFMFYGGVVVDVGGRILGSETQQGFITQSVTNYLNLAGLVCLLVWTEQLWYERKRGVTKLEWGTLIVTGVSLAMLAGIHLSMDQSLDSVAVNVINPTRFDINHKLYIGISSLQWLASLTLLFLTLQRWNASHSK
jgi:hypothetical protein